MNESVANVCLTHTMIKCEAFQPTLTKKRKMEYIK